MAEKKKIGVTLDPELHAKVKSTAALRGTNVERAYAAALERWLGEPAPVPVPPPYREENLPLHDKLERILNSGDVGTIAAVVPNIEIFNERLKPVRGYKHPLISKPEDLGPKALPPRKRASGKS